MSNWLAWNTILLSLSILLILNLWSANRDLQRRNDNLIKANRNKLNEIKELERCVMFSRMKKNIKTGENIKYD